LIKNHVPSFPCKLSLLHDSALMNIKPKLSQKGPNRSTYSTPRPSPRPPSVFRKESKPPAHAFQRAPNHVFDPADCGAQGFERSLAKRLLLNLSASSLRLVPPARRRSVAVQVDPLKANFETRISLDRFQGLKPGAFQSYGPTDFNLYSPAAYTSAMVGDGGVVGVVGLVWCCCC
jgi:hypothetical protein